VALGKRGGVQGEFWVSAEDLQKSPGHPFYQKLNASCPNSRSGRKLLVRIALRA
jgi:hypothetical protein